MTTAVGAGRIHAHLVRAAKEALRRRPTIVSEFPVVTGNRRALVDRDAGVADDAGERAQTRDLRAELGADLDRANECAL